MEQKQLQVFQCIQNYYPISKIPKYTSHPENAFLDNIIHRFIQQSDSSSIHSLISENINLLVPDINTQYTNNVPCEKLASWIKISKLYMRTICDEFLKKCLDEENKIQQIRLKIQRANEFNIARIDYLPEDIVGVIYSFLLPKTRCLLLLYKYPISLINENLRKLSASILRGLTVSIYEKYFIKVYNLNAIDIRSSIIVNFKKVYKNKDQAISQIIEFIKQLILFQPKSVALIQYFDDMSFRLLRTLVYHIR